VCVLMLHALPSMQRSLKRSALCTVGYIFFAAPVCCSVSVGGVSRDTLVRSDAHRSEDHQSAIAIKAGGALLTVTGSNALEVEGAHDPPGLQAAATDYRNGRDVVAERAKAQADAIAAAAQAQADKIQAAQDAADAINKVAVADDDLTLDTGEGANPNRTSNVTENATASPANAQPQGAPSVEGEATEDGGIEIPKSGEGGKINSKEPEQDKLMLMLIIFPVLIVCTLMSTCFMCYWYVNNSKIVAPPPQGDAQPSY